MTLIDIEVPPVPSEDQAPTVTAARPTPTAPRAETRPVRTAPARVEPRRKLFGDLAAPLSRTWGFALIAAWVVVVAVGLAVEPAPVNPDAAPPLMADIVSTALMATWGAMAAGVFQGRRLAAGASLAGGAGLLALTLACPTSGHHGFGAWWGVQIVGAVALMALSRRALRSS